MTGREAALLVIAGLTVTAAANYGGARLARKRPQWPGDEALLTGIAACCAAWAAIGWAWWLAGGAVR